MWPDYSTSRQRKADPPIEGPVPLGRRRHGWQSVQGSPHSGVTTREACIKLAHHPLSPYRSDIKASQARWVIAPRNAVMSITSAGAQSLIGQPVAQVPLGGGRQIREFWIEGDGGQHGRRENMGPREGRARGHCAIATDACQHRCCGARVGGFPTGRRPRSHQASLDGNRALVCFPCNRDKGSLSLGRWHKGDGLTGIIEYVCIESHATEHSWRVGHQRLQRESVCRLYVLKVMSQDIDPGEFW
jgi:hypothetical protein